MGIKFDGPQNHLVDPATGRQVLPAVSREKLLPFFLPIYEDAIRGFRIDPFLEELDARTVLGLERLLSTCEPLARHYLTNEINESFLVLANTESQSALNNLGVFGQLVYGLAAYPLTVYLNGLRTYAEFSRIGDWLVDASGEQVDAALSVVRLTILCKRSRLVEDDRQFGPVPSIEASVVFTDRFLMDRVIADPLLADDIAAIVREDSTIDPDTVRLMIDFDQKALREGAL